MQINYDLDPKKFQIGVVGGGSWGTALANLLASKGYAIFDAGDHIKNGQGRFSRSDHRNRF